MLVILAIAMWLADFYILKHAHHGHLSPAASWFVIVTALLGGILLMIAIAQAQSRNSGKRKHH